MGPHDTGLPPLEEERARWTVKARLGHSKRWSSVVQEEALLETESELLKTVELLLCAAQSGLPAMADWVKKMPL